jgi:hypothetical protein
MEREGITKLIAHQCIYAHAAQSPPALSEACPETVAVYFSVGVFVKSIKLRDLPDLSFELSATSGLYCLVFTHPNVGYRAVSKVVVRENY